MTRPLSCCLAPTIAALRRRIHRWTRPSTRPILGYLADRFRSPAELAHENALLRKQLEVGCRQIARPRFTRADRGMLVLLARLCPTWRSATLLVQPDTILRWHRQPFQRCWRRHGLPMTRSPSSKPWQGITGSGVPSVSAGSCSSSTFASPSARSSGTYVESGSHDHPASAGRHF